MLQLAGMSLTDLWCYSAARLADAFLKSSSLQTTLGVASASSRYDRSVSALDLSAAKVGPAALLLLAAELKAGRGIIRTIRSLKLGKNALAKGDSLSGDFGMTTMWGSSGPSAASDTTGVETLCDALCEVGHVEELEITDCGLGPGLVAKVASLSVLKRVST